MITESQLKTRMEQERQVVRHLIRTAHAAGYFLYKVDDGEESIKVTTEDEALAAVFAVDESFIRFRRAGAVTSHCVFIVLGNSGPECLADCSEGEGWDAVMGSVYLFCEALAEDNG